MRLLSADAAPAADTAPPRAVATTALFAVAILVGAVVGMAAPGSVDPLSASVDPLILLLLGLLFFEVRLDGLPALRRAPRTVALALGMNFLLIPVVALVLTSILVPDEALRVGVLIYCMAPCTDWFLGFTRMAGGDTVVGAALIPINMAAQLALYPVYLLLFTGESTGSALGVAGSTLIGWFLWPAAIAIAARLIIALALPRRWRERVLGLAGALVPPAIAAVIVCLFAANARTIVDHPAPFAWVLVVVFLFFACTYLLGEGAARLGRLGHREHVLLTMTTSARNAPLMLAVTTIALPDRPMVHAAIVLGMLIEFPHLTVLTHLLRRRDAPSGVPGAVPAP